MTKFFFHTWFFATAKRSWMTLLALLGGVALMAPLAPRIADVLSRQGFLHAALLLAFLLPFTYIILYFIYTAMVVKIRAYFILLLSIVTAVSLTLPDRNTVEHIHVLVYALLAVFFYKTGSFYLNGLASYATPLILAVLMGVADESLQSLVPGRTLDFRDVSDNAVGALLGITFVWIRNRYGVNGLENSPDS